MQQIGALARRGGVRRDGVTVTGDDQLELLYRAEQPGLVHLALLLVRDRAVAEELVQEAFVRVHGRLDGVERPGAYLRTTLVNLCRGHGRRVAVAGRAAEPEPPVAPPPALPADVSAVWLALGTLPERQRQALVLRYYLDLDDTAIGELLGARPGTVRSLISRGIAQLKEVVEP